MRKKKNPPKGDQLLEYEVVEAEENHWDRQHGKPQFYIQNVHHPNRERKIVEDDIIEEDAVDEIENNKLLGKNTSIGRRKPFVSLRDMKKLSTEEKKNIGGHYLVLWFCAQ